jgi:hypothetical protein
MRRIGFDEIVGREDLDERDLDNSLLRAVDNFSSR